MSHTFYKCLVALYVVACAIVAALGNLMTNPVGR